MRQTKPCKCCFSDNPSCNKLNYIKSEAQIRLHQNEQHLREKSAIDTNI